MFNLKADIEEKRNKSASIRKEVIENGDTITKICAPLVKVLPWSKKKKKEVVSQKEETKVDSMNLEEAEKYQRTTEILKAKQKLYEKMTSGEVIPDEESSELFLVDFEQKSIDAWRDKKEKGLTTKAPEVDVSVKDVIKKEVKEVKSEWVEYVDVFGRTRTCHKDDLDIMQNIDKKIQGENQSRDLMSDDMRREEERLKWEAETEEAIQNQKDLLHYQDLREAEVRELGVGYYAFSRSREDREAEMKRLRELRIETEKKKLQHIENEKKEKVQLLKRLEKIRSRKIKKLQSQGKEIPQKLLEPLQLDDEKKEEKLIKEENAEEPVKILSPAEVSRRNKTRAWDKDKEPLWTPKEAKKMPRSWEDPHSRRDEDFAPPSSYSDYEPKRRKTEDVQDLQDHSDLQHHPDLQEEDLEEEISDAERARRLLESIGTSQCGMTSSLADEEEENPLVRDEGHLIKMEMTMKKPKIAVTSSLLADT